MKMIRKAIVGKKKRVLEIKPEHFGEQNRNLSVEIDEILYCEGKT